MANQLTDISGIGDKTAEKLKSKGIGSPSDAVDALERGDDAVVDASSRVQSGIREYAVEERGGLFDSSVDVEVTPENQPAVDMFASRDTGSLNDAGQITRNNSDVRGSLLDIGRQAGRGELLSNMRSTPTQQEITDTKVGPSPEKIEGRAVDDRDKLEAEQTRRNIAEMGFDVAANVSGFARETIASANERRQEAETRGRRDPKTDFTKTQIIDIGPGEPTESETEIRANPREAAAARRVHNARPPNAKRTDNRRKAPVTGDFDKWVNAPGEFDYPGVDTPERGPDAGSGFGYTPEETSLEASVKFTPADQDNTFQVKETAADGGGFGRVERGAGEILSAPQEEQQIILGDLIPDEQTQEEIGLDPKGPDKDFFGFSDPVARPER